MFDFLKRKKPDRVVESFEGYVYVDDLEKIRRNSKEIDLSVVSLWGYKPVAKSVKVRLQVIEEEEE